ncbi:hypothetical protein BCR35DRAFT_328182 [Leucosporidium creatinivorum]|uniref:Uncharacterized protein n=1 Tax=Leucosporidium creatinivorum TaxID=106004 RepID=A0A1Y2G6F8_9BASI|nr:hypothetical protein BCR35DRAFT_328182 [Leucosporidium creatinivorum]
MASRTRLSGLALLRSPLLWSRSLSSLYIVYVVVISVYLAIIYFNFIETKGYTAEECALLLDQPKGQRTVVKELAVGITAR